MSSEPLFTMHIDFTDGSNPVVYFNQTLGDIADILAQWAENWIMYPDSQSSLNGIWYWHAKARKEREKNGKGTDSESKAAVFAEATDRGE